MKILFLRKSLTQRFRALLQILDTLVDRGHTVFIYGKPGKSGVRRRKSTWDRYEPSDFYYAPWGVDNVSPGSLRYLRDNFGFEVRHLDKIEWIGWGQKDQVEVTPDILLATDFYDIKVPNQVNLPHISFHSKTREGDILVGNSMCEAVYLLQKQVREIKGKLLLIHPGGGRDVISPLRRHIPEAEVVGNNVTFFNRIFTQLPKGIKEVVIKAHPAPYLYCDRESLQNEVLPRVDRRHFDCRVVEGELLRHICESQFVVCISSSTATWLLGSDKQWVTVTDCAKYNLDADKRRDKEHRTEKVEEWEAWPQKVTMAELSGALADYPAIQKKQKELEKTTDVFANYRDLHRLPYTENMVNLIERMADEE